MLTINTIPDTDICKFEVEGLVDEATVEQFNDFFDEVLERHEKIKLLAVVRHYPGFQSLKVLLSSGKLKFKAFKTVKKYAVMSDQNWMQVLLPVGNFLTPGLPVKHFHLNEEQKAIDWLNTDKAAGEYTADEYLTQMDINHIHVAGTNIYTFKIADRMDEAGMAALYQIIQDAGKGKINLLGEVDKIPKIQSLKTLVDGIKLDLSLIGKIDKYAIVSDAKWVENSAKIGDFFTPNMQMKAFRKAEKDAAMEWLKS